MNTINDISDSNWWREIPDCNGLYKISKEGVIVRIYKTRLKEVKTYQKSGRRSGWYCKILGKEYLVMKIMCHVWVGLPPKGMVAYHKDGILSNNHYLNIGFITRSELGYKNGHKSKSISVEKYDKDGNVIEVYRSIREAGKQNFMSYQAVWERCHGITKHPFKGMNFSFRFERGYKNG